jgi:hypothetical protein
VLAAAKLKVRELFGELFEDETQIGADDGQIR